MDFWKCFCLRSNLSKDGRISALRPGLKTGVENDINPNTTKSFQERFRGGSDLVIIRFLVEVPLKSFGFSFILVNSLS